MKLTFTKAAGKSDSLLIEREDTPTERVTCPKQRIIPHDMVHYAVESIVTRAGFLSKVANGAAATFQRVNPENDAEAVERLVETIQADAWFGKAPSVEIIELYKLACAARSHPSFPVTETEVDCIRQQIGKLTAKWDAVPVHGSLTLTWGDEA